MNEIMSIYLESAEFTALSLPKSYEVILFDLSEGKREIVLHRNKIKGSLKPVKELLKETLKNESVLAHGKITGRPLATEYRTLIKSNISFISDRGKIIGAYCINFACDDYLKIQNMLSDVLSFDLTPLDEVSVQSLEQIHAIQEPSFDSIRTVLDEIGTDPQHMTPAEREEAIIEMFDAGVFELKGAVERVAKAMNISTQSVYRYASGIRKARGL